MSKLDTIGRIQNRRIDWKTYWKRAIVVVMELTFAVTLLTVALFPISMVFSSPWLLETSLLVLSVCYLPLVISYTKTIKETFRYFFPLLGGTLVFFPLSYWINYTYGGTMTTPIGVITLSSMMIPVGVITIWASLRLK
jgi:sensor histidine kinase YesM